MTGEQPVEPKRKIANIRDVAESAQVSPKTVSNYLNGTAKVNQDTGDRIAKAVAKLKYRPHGIAKRFRTGKTFVIGFVTDLDLLDQPVTQQIEYELQQRFWQSKYSLVTMVIDSTNNCVDIDTSLVDGLIVTSGGEKLLRLVQEADLPTVYLRRMGAKQQHTLVVDNYEGGAIAARHLLENNHEKIGVLSNSSALVGEDFSLRKRGFLDELGRHGIKPVLEMNTPLSLDKLQSWFVVNGLEILSRNMTACFVTTDIAAIAFMSFCSTHGVRVPSDLSIIGYDNISLSAISSPPLTTIGGRWEIVARLGAQHIMEEIAGGVSEGELVTIQPRLFERQTVQAR